MNPQDFQRARRSTLLGGERDKSPRTTLKFGSIVATFVGWGLGVYCGFIVLMLVLATAAVLFAGWKLLSPDRKILLPSVGLQGGQIITILIGSISMGKLGANLIDVVWCVAGLAWLIARPGRAAIGVLVVYQLLGLAVNLSVFLHAPLGSLPFRALIMHMIWRVLSLLAMGVLYRKLYHQSSPSEVPSPAE